MDELDGRAAARAAGLTVIGTLGLLDRAAAGGLVDFSKMWQKLQTTGFYASPRLVAEFFRRDELRRRAA